MKPAMSSRIIWIIQPEVHASYYSTLSITRILENSNVSKTRTNSPVPWPSQSSLDKKLSKTRISRFLEHFCQSLGRFSLVNSNFHPNFWENSNSNFRVFDSTSLENFHQYADDDLEKDGRWRYSTTITTLKPWNRGIFR